MMRREDVTGYAVDIGGTKTAVARIAQGRIAAKSLRPTDGAADLPGHLDAVEAMLAALGWNRGSALLGCAVTGRIDAGGLWSAVNAGTLAMERAPLGAALNERFGTVTLRNDAAATTLAEYRFGAGAGARNFAYVTVSTGVGGGLIVAGRLLESDSGLAGHLGFSTLRGGSTRCGSGRVGTVESVASGNAIAASAAQAGHPGLDARAVFAAAAGGAAWAEAIVDRSAAAIAELVANLAAILDPDRIAIGGSIGLAPGFVERIRSHLAQEPDLFRPTVVAAELGADGPLLGALAASQP